MNRIERNQFDNRDSLELGNTAQDKFKILAQQRGWQVVDANQDQDINEHWDFLIIKKSNGEEYRVDVKARKRISRWDNSQQDEWIWIEFHGVRENDLGWLYGGRADLFAFEMIDRFVIITKTNLQSIAENKVAKNERVNSAKDAKYKIYSRAGRPDVISLIEMKLIVASAWDIWEKK